METVKKPIHGELWKGSYQVPAKVLNFGRVEGSFPCHPIRNQFLHWSFYEIQNSLDFLTVVRNHVWTDFHFLWSEGVISE